ncbi:hypothetical protein [Candidatus Magnetobacterium casense]|uniref:Uncharacterized protein n=1 Tax=Candidatus Magnetobacterium casense TaxID=1455061 RepID=A0ABS6S1U9_9BACT|nr:hypothetical protein [Candidatus Magnetobacterium casensis]MBV6342814.1 hypothetical protein [Candidatus Magnetobacterium casensis]
MVDISPNPSERQSSRLLSMKHTRSSRAGQPGLTKAAANIENVSSFAHDTNPYDYALSIDMRNGVPFRDILGMRMERSTADWAGKPPDPQNLH